MSATSEAASHQINGHFQARFIRLPVKLSQAALGSPFPSPRIRNLPATPWLENAPAHPFTSEHMMSRPRAHIVGVGESKYARWGKIGDVTEHALACQAIQNAVADAGLSMRDVDGLASFAEDRNEAIFLAAELGLDELRFGNMVWMPGGGGGCAGGAACSSESHRSIEGWAGG